MKVMFISIQTYCCRWLTMSSAISKVLEREEYFWLSRVLLKECVFWRSLDSFKWRCPIQCSVFVNPFSVVFCTIFWTWKFDLFIVRPRSRLLLCVTLCTVTSSGVLKMVNWKTKILNFWSLSPTLSLLIQCYFKVNSHTIDLEEFLDIITKSLEYVFINIQILPKFKQELINHILLDLCYF